MAGQPGLFDSEDRLRTWSATGDLLEGLARVVDFELFCGDLETTLSRSDRTKGGRPPYDAVLMFMCGHRVIAAVGAWVADSASSPARAPGGLHHRRLFDDSLCPFGGVAKTDLDLRRQ
jgi:hypothetical protein